MRFTCLKNKIINLYEIEWIDDSLIDNVKIHMKSGKEIIINQKELKILLADLSRIIER